MSTNEKKGVTVKIDADLHAEVKRYIEEHGTTMGDRRTGTSGRTPPET